MGRRSDKAGALLLGSDHKALGVARSLGARGIPTIVVDNLPRSAWFSRYVRQRVRWHGPMEDESLVAYLITFGKKHALDGWVLFPMQDEVVELVARHACDLGTVYRLATQDWSVLQWAGDKRLTDHMAAQAGVPYPRTWYPASADELETLDVTYPAIIKPAISVHLQYAIRLKALPAYSLDDLRTQYQRAVHIIQPDEVMIQEIIPGSGSQQVSVAAYCKEGRPILRMTARRLRQYPIDFGLGSSFVEAVEIPELFELADKVLAYMRVTGMVEVEFKLDPRDGTYKLLDVNVRPWGWHTLCRACGLDFPYIQYRDLMGLEPAPQAPRYGYKWVRLATDVPAGLQEVRAGLTTRRAYLSSLMGKVQFSVLDWRDPVPTLGDFGSILMRGFAQSVARSRQKRAHA
jgi:D-aspartate ligase